MENFKLDARQVKSAMVMQAKNDVRYYLNGLLIGGNKIVATDGHRMIVVDSEEATFEPAIFTIKGILPNSAKECEFVFIGEDYGVITCTSSRGQEMDKVIKFAIVEGRFPNHERVIPSGECKKYSEVAFNLEYMADIAKSAKCLGGKYVLGKIKLYGDNVPTAVIEINTPETNAKCIVMGARL